MNRGRALIGILLVVVGGLFLLDGLGVYDAGELIGDWWPVVLIGAGLYQLWAHPGHYVGPGFLVLLGALLLVSTLDLFDVTFWELFWPALIIALGLSFIFGRQRRSPDGDPRDVINAVQVFSGSDIKSSSRHFKGGSIVSVFGGADLDLRDAQLDAGGASIDVVAVFGGADIIVPEGWDVRCAGLPLFGGFSDKTGAGSAGGNGPLLDVGGVALFGGVEVKHKTQG